MSRSIQLYNLIHSLSRGEKRQFRLSTSKYEKKNKNISGQLFDVFDSMQKWDEAVFSEKLHKAGISKHISVHINMLITQLLASLRQKEEEDNLSFIIGKLLEESYILFNRDEYELALTRIKKAKSMASEAELFVKLLEIHNHERDIQFRLLGTTDFNKFRKKFIEETKKILGLIRNQTDYLNLVEEIFYVYRTIGYPQQEFEKSKYAEIIQDPLLLDINKAKSSNAKSSYYFVHTIYYLGLNEIEDARNIVLQQLKVYERNKLFLKAHVSTYISIMNNLLVLQSQLGSVEDFLGTLKKLRTVPKELSLHNKYVERRIFESSYSAELDFYIIKDMMDKMAEVIPAVESNIASMGKEGVSFDRFMNLALRIAIYYYRIGDDEQSHEWVKQIIDYEGSKSTIHIISYAILLDIIMHFKNGDFDYLQYRINSVQSFFKKHKRLIQVNILFFRTIKQLMRSRTMQNVDKVLDNFRTEFEECPNSLTKRYYLKYLVIEEWLDKKFDMEQRLKAYSKKY